ncbi:MAG: membrane lipoprotein [Francisellaceae bacterium]
MKGLGRLSCAFSSGAIGAIALMVTVYIFKGATSDYKETLYRLMVWGGIWGLLLILPIFKNNWFIRGSLLAVLVILFNFIVLMPATGAGFFAYKAGLNVFFGNLIFNYIWGIVAAIWYQLAMKY